MEAGFFEMLAGWPTVSLALVGLFALYHAVRLMSLTFGWGMGTLGTYWRTRRAISHGEADDLRRHVAALDKRVRAFMYRDECYFAFVLVDREWHHRQELLAAANGWQLDRHVTFLEFRDKWMVERGLEKELELWK